MTRPPLNSTRRGVLLSSAGLAAGWAGLQGGPPPVEAKSRPSVRGTEMPEERERLAQLVATLDARGEDRELGVIDLDAVDHNLQRVRSTLAERFTLRLVTKSLPSVELVSYLMAQAPTSAVMVFTETMLAGLLQRHGHALDALTGRPFGAAAVRRVFEAVAGAPEASPAAEVRWLVDTPGRAAALERVAEELGVTLRVAIELDVGLRRGGARDTHALGALLDPIARSPRLQLAGFMGYDGHVPFAPFGFSQAGEMQSVLQRYQSFVAAANTTHPNLMKAELVYNSGGSRTYSMFGPASAPINDVAVGSAILYPHSFRDLPDAALRRATFLASPVLKCVEPSEVPFVSGALSVAAHWDERWQVAYFLHGGDFPAERITPADWVRNPLMPSPSGVHNLVPNQSQWLGPAHGQLRPGQHVLFHPWEGDGLAWLDTVQVFRGSAHTGEWSIIRKGRA